MNIRYREAKQKAGLKIMLRYPITHLVISSLCGNFEIFIIIFLFYLPDMTYIHNKIVYNLKTLYYDKYEHHGSAVLTDA